MIHPRRLRPFMKPILVLQEILQGNSTAVLVSGYSHRWHVGTKENINRTTLLLQDAIGWAIRNVLPHISEILYPDSMSKSEKKKNFAENCLVCTLLNRIVNCLPGTIINPWCLFETSSMPPAAGKIIYEIRVIFIAEAMNGRYVTKQVMVGGKVIQKENCLSLLVVSNSQCTGGSTIVMMNSNRLYAPGLAECRVITEDKYFTYPIAGEVYKVAGPGKPLMKIADTSQMSQETSKGEKHLEGYTVELRFDPSSLISDCQKDDRKRYPLARVIYSSVFSFFAPLSTMDHIDGHQFNGIHNVANCHKMENLGRKSKNNIPTALIARRSG